MFSQWFCIACLVCGSFPDWPEDGIANKDWVIEAIEWRLDRGANNCTDITQAIDALSLEWIANTSDVRVEIETENWPVFTFEPALQGTLIQIIALELLLEHKSSDVKILKKLRRYTRRSEDLMTDELKMVFEENLELLKNKPSKNKSVN
tara:strand:+ start:130 stop:576 length:447 start_codon:yes stop_codon:yes gene_type:complete